MLPYLVSGIQGCENIGPSTVLAHRPKGLGGGTATASLLQRLPNALPLRYFSALSFTISRTQWWPGRPVTPPPAWVALDA